MSDEPDWLPPTSGRFLGFVGLSMAAAVLVLVVLSPGESYALSVGAGAAFVGVLSWAALLRPRVALTDRHLVMRNMLETVHLPLASIETLACGSVLLVRAGGRRYVSPAIGTSLRKTYGRSFGGGQPNDAARDRTPDKPYADYVVDHIKQACKDARSLEGVQQGSSQQEALAGEVRTQRAIPEIAGLAVTGATFVASLLV